jgi:hypothetical protein
MKKIMLLLVMLVNFVYGMNYNELLLKTQASIFPKIMLLDKKLNEKLVDGKIVYTIVYEKNDFSVAQEIRQFIDTKYKGHFDGYEYKINLVEFSNLSTKTKASAIYMLNSDKSIKKVANIAKEKGIIAFSYDINNLKHGLLFSLMLEKSTVLYMNKESLSVQKIDFVDSLLQMVRFIGKDSS